MYRRRTSNSRDTVIRSPLASVGLRGSGRGYRFGRTALFIACLIVLTLAPAAGEEPGTNTGPCYANRYTLSSEGTLTARDSSTGTVRVLNETLPVKVSHPFDPALRDPVFAFACDPAAPDRIAAATPRGVSISQDGGRTWTDLPVTNGISPNIHFTAVALSPFRDAGYLAGTSFDGLYETVDGGKTWTHVTETARFLYRGAGFYEEIAAAAYDPADRNSLYLAAGFGNGLYRYARNTRSWERIELPEPALTAGIRRIEFQAAGEQGTAPMKLASTAGLPQPGRVSSAPSGTAGEPVWELVVETAAGTWRRNRTDGTWEAVSDPAAVDRTGTGTAGTVQAEPDPGTSGPDRAPLLSTGSDRETESARLKRDRLELVRNKTGIYLSAEQARPANLAKHLEFIETHGLNSLVVDFKDDFGYLTYDSSLERAKAAGAVRARFKAADLIAAAHDRGLYLIARIVVFKDRQLYRYDNGRYALRDRVTGGPWGDIRTVKDPETGEEHAEQLEFWVDPYSAEVWEYNIAIAKELQELGVDEIQFDYIRFPSDGNVSRITSRYQKPGMTKVNALESFLSLARSALTVPIGTDVYGFNAWFRMKYIGQDIEMFSRYVDVISPMFYPSHFPGDFLGDLRYLPRAERIYREGTDRAVEIAGPGCVIRPYVQAFLIGGELAFEKPTYTEYLIRQLEGLSASPGAGFTLWNASGRYYMVTRELGNYTGAAERE